MDKFNVPGDNGSSFRPKTMIEMLKPSKEGYVDGATDYCLLVPFADDKNLSKNDRVWLAFLYGLTYSCTTSIRSFCCLGEFENLTTDKLNKFWSKYKESLYFNPDKRYIKNNDQFVEAVESFILSEGDTPFKSLKPYLKKGFECTYKHILKEWRFFGPHGAYLFFDALYGLLPEWYVDPERLDWKHSGNTVIEGMCHMLYLDEKTPYDTSNNYNYSRYDVKVNRLQEISKQPKIIIESTLCAFRKLFKQTRYVGYYADRMLEECKLTEKYTKDLVDIWDYRKRTIPAYLRGETKGWDGIQKDRLTLWLDEGKLL